MQGVNNQWLYSHSSVIFYIYYLYFYYNIINFL